MNTVKDFSGYVNPEKMAEDYLTYYYLKGHEIVFPLNPFSFLKEERILFKLNDFSKLEGVYIPASSNNDVAIVGINANRPITRQRFTAAHELCHHLHDSTRQVSCPINGKKTYIEQFADSFAAALLMPIGALEEQVCKYKNERGFVDFDDVLDIANFFGVSFESCLYRIAYKLFAIEGDTKSEVLKKSISHYKPDKVRKQRHITYAKLYADLIDEYQEQLSYLPSKRAKILFQTDYIYNDSRMEGVNVTIEQASEIVADLRLKTQNSVYCNEEYECYLSIAGHYEMYQKIFANFNQKKVSVFEIFDLNKKLFSCYPYPEYGGSIRQTNTLVMGAKFETVDYHSIYAELTNLEKYVCSYYTLSEHLKISDFVKYVVITHHKLTVIHAFQDGNGRTSRAFMNMQLVRFGIPPIYIFVKDKEEYTSALELADKTGDYEELFELILKCIIRSHIELTKQ